MITPPQFRWVQCAQSQAKSVLSRLLTTYVVILLSSSCIFAQRLGLHVTKQELAIWKQRAKSGPYKTKGYSGQNSPGDWDRIISNANSFVSKPSSERWRAHGGSGCVPQWSSEPAKQGVRLRDAAFAYLITGDKKYQTAVRNELIAQSNESTTNFSNRSRWCTGKLSDVNPAFAIADWLTRLVFAYDYVRSSLSSSDRQKLDSWFYNAASYFQENVDHDFNRLFVNRQSGNYTLTQYAVNSKISASSTITHYQGNAASSLAKRYNNRRGAMVRFYAMVGIQQNKDAFKKSAKLYVKELLKFSTYPNGMIAEFERWRENFHEGGFAYASVVIAQTAEIADAFARVKDFELFNYKTSEGMFGSQGGTKSIFLIVKNMLNMMDGSVKRYGTKSGSRTNDNYVINGVAANQGWYAANDIWFAQANVYYKSDYIKSIYTRSSSRMKPYPYRVASVGPHLPWGGPSDIYPGSLFMFGQMEGKVWPYGESSSSPAPSTNYNNPIVVEAYGKKAAGIYAHFVVSVNGTTIGDAYTTGSTKEYKFTTNQKLSDIKTVMIDYDNDGQSGNEMRDLYIKSLTVGSKKYYPNASNVKYDRYRLDGDDVVAGRSDMQWTGALIFQISASGGDIVNNDDDDDSPTPPSNSGGSSSRKLTVNAYGSASNNTFAAFKVVADGATIGQASTTGSSKAYNFTLNKDADDINKLQIVYTNDASSKGKDRNLYVKSIVVGGKEIKSTSSAVIFDRGAIDGKDVMAGRVELRWNGALVFNLPKAGLREGFAEVSGLLTEEAVTLYPNPNPGAFNVKVDMKQQIQAQFAIINSLGQTVYTEEVASNGSVLDKWVNLSNRLSAGMYYLKVRVGNEVITKKFVRQ